jgi:cobalt-zinc-cadmium efflux system protein
MHSHAHHGDDHGHGHSHARAAASFGRAFAIGVALNAAFVVVEAAGGVLAHSVALLSDAGHNFGDVLALAIAWLAAVLARRAPTARFTYGLRSSSILAALFNGTLLLVAVGALSWEALRRFGDPQPVAGGIVMAIAGAGVVVNGVTAALFASGRGDLNLRGAYLHMAADAVVSVGVMVAGLAVLITGWLWLDPLVSLAVNAAIVWGTWGLLSESLEMAMAAAPRHIEPGEVRAFLAARPGVTSVHDLHIWPMSTTETALTCHLVIPGGRPGDAFLHDLSVELDRRFAIPHATVQIEIDPNFACTLAPDEVV